MSILSQIWQVECKCNCPNCPCSKLSINAKDYKFEMVEEAERQMGKEVVYQVENCNYACPQGHILQTITLYEYPEGSRNYGTIE